MYLLARAMTAPFYTVSRVMSVQQNRGRIIDTPEVIAPPHFATNSTRRRMMLTLRGLRSSCPVRPCTLVLIAAGFVAVAGALTAKVWCAGCFSTGDVLAVVDDLDVVAHGLTSGG